MAVEESEVDEVEAVLSMGKAAKRIIGIVVGERYTAK